MDSFEVNKIIAAVLLVALLLIGLGKISNTIFKVQKPEIDGYKVEVIDGAKISEKPDDDNKEVKELDINSLIALGSLEHGEKVFKKCSACHSIQKGGGNKIGPALYNVLRRDIGALSDYKYSKAMLAFEGNWDLAQMNGYLKKPQSYIKGTKMAFAGLRKDKDRASVILYLNKNSDNPLDLP